VADVTKLLALFRNGATNKPEGGGRIERQLMTWSRANSGNQIETPHGGASVLAVPEVFPAFLRIFATNFFRPKKIPSFFIFPLEYAQKPRKIKPN